MSMMRVFLKLWVMFSIGLFSWEGLAEQAKISVVSIKVIEQTYSSAQLEMQLNYDGSIGESVSFGVIPITQESVQSVGFKPYGLKKGTNVLIVHIGRPDVHHVNEFESNLLQIKAYTRHQSENVFHNYEITWPAFASKYESSAYDIDSGDAFEQTETILINEAVPSSEEIIRALNYFGISKHQFNIFYKPIENTARPKLSLRVSEGISLKDLKLVLSILEKEGSLVTNIDVYPRNHEKFQYGRIEIMENHYDGGGTNTSDILDSIESSKSIREFYDSAGIEISSNKLSHEQLMDKVEGLISIGGPFQLREAESILSEALNEGYFRPRLFLLYFKVLNKKSSFPTWIWLVIAGAIFILGRWVNRRYITMPDIESIDIDRQNDTWREGEARAKTQIQRMLNAIEEAKFEVSVLVSISERDEEELIWVTAHGKKDSGLVVSLYKDDPEGHAEPVYGRQTLKLESIIDWMVFEGDGYAQGGFTRLAMFKIYKTKYGRLPKRYKEEIEYYRDA